MQIELSDGFGVAVWRGLRWRPGQHFMHGRGFFSPRTASRNLQAYENRSFSMGVWAGDDFTHAGAILHTHTHIRFQQTSGKLSIIRRVGVFFHHDTLSTFCEPFSTFDCFTPFRRSKTS